MNDLEKMDRRPLATPRAGCKVKIKGREWYEKWKDDKGGVPVAPYFFEEMSSYCGRIVIVDETSLFGADRYRIKEDGNHFLWSCEMFEEVYPLTPASFPTCFRPGIGSPTGIGIDTDWSKILESLPGVTSGQSCFGSISARTDLLRKKWGVQKEPELQMIKKHRFIKIENL